MFKRNKDMIFEQDFAQPHSTNANQEFMEENVPAHTRTLWRYEGEHELFFGPKWDDFFGPSSDFGESCHNVFTETLDQLILAV